MHNKLLVLVLSGKFLLLPKAGEVAYGPVIRALELGAVIEQ